MSIQEAPDKQTRAAAYVAFPTFKTAISDFAEHGLPGRIDRSVLTRFSGSVCGQLLASFKFLGLCTDNGTPTDYLARLVANYGTDHWKNVLNNVLDHAYKPVLAMNLSSATPSQFAEGFASAFPGAEAVLKKSRAFFLAAAVEAGFTIGPRLLAGTKGNGASGTKKRAPRRPQGNVRAGTRDDPPPPPPPPPAGNPASNLPPTSFQMVALLNLSDMNEAEAAAVWTLIQYLKKKEAAATR